MQVAPLARVQARRPAQDRLARPAAHLRIASGDAGVPLKAVQELMGHATIEMTMRYAHLSPDVRRSAVQMLLRAAARAG